MPIAFNLPVMKYLIHMEFLTYELHRLGHEQIDDPQMRTRTLTDYPDQDVI